MEVQYIHSFAVTAYKQSPYLEACIRSIFDQTAKSAVYISTSTPSEYISNIADKYGLRLCVNPGGPGIAAKMQIVNVQPFVVK